MPLNIDHLSSVPPDLQIVGQPPLTEQRMHHKVNHGIRIHTISIRFRHAGLRGQASDVYPALLSTSETMANMMFPMSSILSHANMSDSDAHAEDSLELELDC